MSGSGNGTVSMHEWKGGVAGVFAMDSTSHVETRVPHHFSSWHKGGSTR